MKNWSSDLLGLYAETSKILVLFLLSSVNKVSMHLWVIVLFLMILAFLHPSFHHSANYENHCIHPLNIIVCWHKSRNSRSYFIEENMTWKIVKGLMCYRAQLSPQTWPSVKISNTKTTWITIFLTAYYDVKLHWKHFLFHNIFTENFFSSRYFSFKTTRITIFLTA